MRLLRALRAVLWGFLGVRRGADAARDLQGLHPATVIAAGFVVVALLIGGIATTVHFILGKRATPVREVIESARVAPRAAHGPVQVRDTTEERAAACTACHGSATQATKDGFSPRIAGKPAGYLFNQLVSFRDGRRTYPPMVYLVQYMTDDYLREMAEYFAKLELPYPPPEPMLLSPSQAERARQIIEHGDMARGVPACVACHGKILSGADPAIPGLLGLPRHYISA